ncbi:MAG: O-antigen polymerase [Phycisphaerales bacterium]|nr:O-antigen polymerase [Phycisphaerales bacterium]
MLRGLAGWLLLLGVLYIPWHDGGVAPLSIGILSALVFLASMLWLLGHAFGETRPRIPYVGLACIALLLLQGWWMACNALRRYDPITHSFFPSRGLWRAAPGSWDGRASLAAALAASSMLLTICIVSDLSHYPKWRKRFAYGVALSGALVALVGILKAAGADPLLPALGVRQGTSFASYEYHGNAGTLLNLCLPLAFGLLLHVAHRTHRGSRRVIAAVPLLLIVAGAIVNVSRAAQAITVLLTVGLIAWAFWLGRGRSEQGIIQRWGWQLALAVIAVALMIAGAVATTHSRWSHLPGQMTLKNPRLIMWQVCGYWLADAGPMGYGPGTYKLIYPTTPPSELHELYPRWIVQPHIPGEPVSIWNHVYNDYLQFAFEWGWLGAAVWAILLLGGLVLAVRTARHRSPTFSDATLAGSVVFALAGLYIHAAVDCPLQILSLQFYAGIVLGLGWGSAGWRVEQSQFSVSRLDTPADALEVTLNPRVTPSRPMVSRHDLPLIK